MQDDKPCFQQQQQQQQPHSTLVNMTPHHLHIQFQDPDTGQQVTKTLPTTGQSIRACSKPQTSIGTVSGGIPVYTPPAFQPGVLQGFPYTADKDQVHPDLVVSMVVGEQIPGWYRGNVYMPDTGPDSAVRDKQGKIVAVKRLCLVHDGQQTLVE
jgi:hypothetical protein